jgi:hypothetical protein
LFLNPRLWETGLIDMLFDPLDALFVALVLAIAITLLGGGDGGKRARVPI